MFWLYFSAQYMLICGRKTLDWLGVGELMDRLGCSNKIKCYLISQYHGWNSIIIIVHLHPKPQLLGYLIIIKVKSTKSAWFLKCYLKIDVSQILKEKQRKKSNVLLLEKELSASFLRCYKNQIKACFLY